MSFGVGDTLDPVHAAFKLHAAENALALYLENDLVEPTDLGGIGVHDFDFPTLVHGVTGIRTVEIGGEDTGLGPAGARPNLHNHIPLVVGVLGEKGQPQILG